jgi:hypothetical protein
MSGMEEQVQSTGRSDRTVELAADAERQWLHYLRNLPQSGAVSPFIAASAEQLWRDIQPATGRLPVPDAVATANGGILLAWDRDDHHIEIELMPSGSYDWLYRNRRTGVYAGGEDLALQALAPELLSQLMLTAE